MFRSEISIYCIDDVVYLRDRLMLYIDVMGRCAMFCIDAKYWNWYGVPLFYINVFYRCNKSTKWCKVLIWCIFVWYQCILLVWSIDVIDRLIWRIFVFIDVLIWCIDIMYRYDVFMLCNDVIYWYDVLMLCIDLVYWYYVSIWCIDVM